MLKLDSLSHDYLDNFLSFAKSFMFVLITMTIALPAIAYTLPQRLYLQSVASKSRKQALAKSEVKIKGNDVMASVKILQGIPLVLVVNTIRNLIFFVFFSGRFVNGLAARCLLTVLLSALFDIYIISKDPVFGATSNSNHSAMIQFHNGLNSAFRICRIRIFVIFYRRRIQEIRKQRKELTAKIFDFIAKYNKMVIKKYEEIKDKRAKASKTNIYIDTEEAFSALTEIVNH